MATRQVPSTSGNDAQLAVSPGLGWQRTTPSRINFQNEKWAGVFRLPRSNGRSYKRSPWLGKKRYGILKIVCWAGLLARKGLSSPPVLRPLLVGVSYTESGCYYLQLVLFSYAQQAIKKDTLLARTLHRPIEPIREQTAQTLCVRVTRSCPVVAW